MGLVALQLHRSFTPRRVALQRDASSAGPPACAVGTHERGAFEEGVPRPEPGNQERGAEPGGILVTLLCSVTPLPPVRRRMQPVRMNAERSKRGFPGRSQGTRSAGRSQGSTGPAA
jgi:hypothetical protein